MSFRSDGGVVLADAPEERRLLPGINGRVSSEPFHGVYYLGAIPNSCGSWVSRKLLYYYYFWGEDSFVEGAH